ncbi:cysteine permease [Sulfurospirillum sp. 1612]|uniref:cysteine permease n=1 Tax=Sulfurospirillum sp. 1612 TaxID=3094835 RepID=UPI002F931A1B
MKMRRISYKTTLENYILNLELSKLANISSNAYRFWKNVRVSKYDSCRIVFIDKRTLPEKYQPFVKQCTNLDGYVQSQAFCKFTGLAPSHLIESNHSKIYDILEIKQIGIVKLVNLRKFYDDFDLDYDYHLYIEKCQYFGPEPFEKKIRLSEDICLGYY